MLWPSWPWEFSLQVKFSFMCVPKNLKVSPFLSFLHWCILECILFVGSVIVSLFLFTFLGGSFSWHQASPPASSPPCPPHQWSAQLLRCWSGSGHMYSSGLGTSVLTVLMLSSCDWLGTVWQEVQHPIRERSCQPKWEELLKESLWDHSVECWATVNEQHSYICVPAF